MSKIIKKSGNLMAIRDRDFVFMEGGKHGDRGMYVPELDKAGMDRVNARWKEYCETNGR